MPEPSSLALSARNITICLRTGLPNRRNAQRLATFQLMIAQQVNSPLWRNRMQNG